MQRATSSPEREPRIESAASVEILKPSRKRWKLRSKSKLSSASLAQRASACPCWTSSVAHPLAAPWKSASSRSEEHTSELQSLMRISYAVFCLKKKQKKPHHR